MNVLVVGGGGREHALAWKLARSALVKRVFAAPGNPGIARVADCVNIPATDIRKLLKFAKDNGVALTVVGPEAPLVAGIADAFRREGLKVFGPGKAGAQLEGSKAFAKELMRSHSIPCARYEHFNTYNGAIEYVRKAPLPLVVKVDGLAAGKGVTVCTTREQAVGAVDAAMKERIFAEAGDTVVVEEFLSGEEATMTCLTDGRSVLSLESSQDHKSVFDGNNGPNTGGMGAFSPAAIVSPEVYRHFEREIMLPTVHALKVRGTPFVGVIYFGLMVSSECEPRVLEYNVRFGDPETQPLVLRLKADLAEILLLAVENKLDQADVDWDRRPAVCVVAASAGYPGSYRKGLEITGIEDAQGDPDIVVFHAGTAVEDGRLVTAGGRVLGVTALGATASQARQKAYAALQKIHFEGMHFRRDIAGGAVGGTRRDA